MDILHSGSDLGTLALGLIIAGAVSGLTAGMLGVGGGIVVVPVLYHVLALMGIDPGIRMHIAVGTSLATIIPTAFASVRAHDKKGAVDWALLRRWAIPMLVGVAIGRRARRHRARADAGIDLRARRHADRDPPGVRRRGNGASPIICRKVRSASPCPR